MENEIIESANKLYKYGLQIFGTDWLRTWLPERIAQETERSLYGVNNANAAALFIARRYETAGETQRRTTPNTPTIQINEIIENFAKQNNIWILNTDTFFHNKYGSPSSYGSEATVYFDNEKNIVVKTIDTEVYNNDTPKAIYRILIHNILFPETSLKITAFGQSQYGLFEIITEQKFIEGEFVTIEQFESELQKIGLQKNKGDWENEFFFMSDIKPKNAIIDTNGKVQIIDCYLELKF